MRKGGSKQKGSAFERKVCKDLSLWISNGTQKDIFWRSAMSGGRSTVALKRGDKLGAQAGDISAVHGLGNSFVAQFMVECKCVRTLDHHGLIKGIGHLVDYWSRAVKDAKTYGKIPLLIAKQNNQPTLACTNKMGERQFLIPPEINRIRIYHLDMIIILFDDFLEINPKVLER